MYILIHEVVIVVSVSSRTNVYCCLLVISSNWMSYMHPVSWKKLFMISNLPLFLCFQLQSQYMAKFLSLLQFVGIDKSKSICWQNQHLHYKSESVIQDQVVATRVYMTKDHTEGPSFCLKLNLWTNFPPSSPQRDTFYIIDSLSSLSKYCLYPLAQFVACWQFFKHFSLPVIGKSWMIHTSQWESSCKVIVGFSFTIQLQSCKCSSRLSLLLSKIH